MQRFLLTHWYKPSLSWVMALFIPLSGLFALVAAARRFAYRVGLLRTVNPSVPVWVVGNISVGGTGKTPFVIWLAGLLQSLGFRPGIVSRGMGGEVKRLPRMVTRESDVHEVGDEALLMVRRTGCPMAVGADRVKAVEMLLKQSDCDVVISDDGLQHYALGRVLEIVLVDGLRKFGNGWLLPAGPLREPLSRLDSVDMMVVNQSQTNDLFTMQMVVNKWVPMVSSAPALSANQTIHAVAGIGHPDRFFQVLRDQGYTLIEHVFPDHYQYQPDDFIFNDDLPIVMTEKDAVKCLSFADKRFWYVESAAEVNAACRQRILMECQMMKKGMNHDAEEDFAKSQCRSRVLDANRGNGHHG